MSQNPVRRSRLPIAAVTLFIGGLLWIAAFWLPVFITANNSIPGYWVFATGWMGFTFFQFAWYANLLILLAVMVMYTYPLRATLIAGLAVLVATQSFWFDVIPDSTQSTAIIGQGAGFWMWYLSIVLMGAGVVFGSDNEEPDMQRTESRAAPQPAQPALKNNTRLEAPAWAGSEAAVSGQEQSTSPVLSLPPDTEDGLLLAELLEDKVDQPVNPDQPVLEPVDAYPLQSIPEITPLRSASPLFSDDWPHNPGLVVARHIPSIADEDRDEIQFFTGKQKAGTRPASEDDPWKD